MIAMIVIYNTTALGMAILAAAAEMGVNVGLKLGSTIPSGLTAGIILLVADLLYRWKRGQRNWFRSRGGGSVFWVPIWGCGLGLVAFALWKIYVDATV